MTEMKASANHEHFGDWIQQSYGNGGHFTMACPDQKFPLDWTGQRCDFKKRHSLNQILAHVQSGKPTGVIPSTLRLLCVDFDFPADLPEADWPTADALLAELKRRDIKHFIEPSRTPGRLHIWVFVDQSFTKPRFGKVTLAGVEYEVRYDGGHTIIWHPDDFIRGGKQPTGKGYLDNPTFNAIFHIAANTKDGTANQGGGKSEVYETGNEYVVRDELIQALLANSRDQSLIVENGEWLKVENPCDMSDNMTCRLSFNKSTGAAMDFKSELRYSPIELAKALSLTVHKRKGRPKAEAPEGQIEVVGKNLKGLRAALSHLNISIRLNIRASAIEYRRDDKDWQSFDEASRHALREAIADRFCYQRSDSKYSDLRFGSDSFTNTLWAHVHEHRVDPFIEYLETLPEWDKQQRLDDLLIDMMGAAEDDLTYWGARFLFIGQIQRAYDPGCQLDEALVLVGRPRLGKSSIVEKSVPWESLHSDSLDLSARYERRIEATLGTSIVEIAEMSGAKKGRPGDIVDYISTRTDKMRLAFRHDPERIPRRFIIVGTTNNRDDIPNHPGALRRFIPVEVHAELDQDALVAIRDQLFAEALWMYKQGIRANMPRNLWGKADARADAFRNRDEVEEILMEVLDDNVKYTWHNIRSLDDRLSALRVGQKRLTQSLRMQGWENRKETYHGIRAMFWSKKS